MKPEVSIVIPVFNQCSYTEKCLASIRLDLGLSEISEIIIINNASTDSTVDFLEKERINWPHFKIISFDNNRGFSEACNTGASQATSDQLVFLNNDTEPQPGWYSALKNTLCISEVGLVGPKLLYPGTLKVNHCGYAYNPEHGGFYGIYHNFPADFIGVNRRRNFQALLGACYLLRKDLFDSLGGFSVYGLEDIDLCFKVRKRGLKVVYEPKSVVLHHGSITLKNSAPGTIPPTDNLGFNRTFPENQWIVDDHIFYSEDGVRIEKVVNEVIHLEEVISHSNALIDQARLLRQAGKLDQAISKLESAIELNLGNLEAYLELITLLLDNKSLDRAIKTAEKMCLHVVEYHKANLVLAQIYERAQNKSNMELCYKRIIEDWCASEEDKRQAQKALFS